MNGIAQSDLNALCGALVFLRVLELRATGRLSATVSSINVLNMLLRLEQRSMLVEHSAQLCLSFLAYCWHSTEPEGEFGPEKGCYR